MKRGKQVTVQEWYAHTFWQLSFVLNCCANHTKATVNVNLEYKMEKMANVCDIGTQT